MSQNVCHSVVDKITHYFSSMTVSLTEKFHLSLHHQDSKLDLYHFHLHVHHCAKALHGHLNPSDLGDEPSLMA